MRAVLDTNVLVRATKNAHGPAREVLRHFEAGDHVLVLSSHILTELLRVLHYPRVQAMHRLTTAECQAFVKSLHDVAEVIVVPHDPAQPISHDPDDDPVIQTAVQGGAEVLCSLDRHLHHQQVRDFCQQHGVQVLTDVELLAVFHGKDSSTDEHD